MNHWKESRAWNGLNERAKGFPFQAVTYRSEMLIMFFKRWTRELFYILNKMTGISRCGTLLFFFIKRDTVMGDQRASRPAHLPLTARIRTDISRFDQGIFLILEIIIRFLRVKSSVFSHLRCCLVSQRYHQRKGNHSSAGMERE